MYRHEGEDLQFLQERQEEISEIIGNGRCYEDQTLEQVMESVEYIKNALSHFPPEMIKSISKKDNTISTINLVNIDNSEGNSVVVPGTVRVILKCTDSVAKAVEVDSFKMIIAHSIINKKNNSKENILTEERYSDEGNIFLHELTHVFFRNFCYEYFCYKYKSKNIPVIKGYTNAINNFVSIHSDNVESGNGFDIYSRTLPGEDCTGEGFVSCYGKLV